MSFFNKLFDNGQNNNSPSYNSKINVSLLISYFTKNLTIMKISEGVIQNLKYSVFITQPLKQSNVNNPKKRFKEGGDILFRLNLPFNATTHIIGLSKLYDIDRLALELFLKENLFKKIDLEGNFSDYFDLYSLEGQDEQVRYVFNPQAMEYVVDYCRNHFWEISNSEMFMAIKSDDKYDENNFINESLQFVNVIKPALKPGEPGAPVVHHDVTYGEYDGPALNCPLCQTTMKIAADYMLCPNGEGVLISARDLNRYQNHEFNIDIPTNNSKVHGPLTCPNCKSIMQAVNYENANIVIDSCPNCIFRWLDMVDAIAISQKKYVKETEDDSDDFNPDHTEFPDRGFFNL